MISRTIELPKGIFLQPAMEPEEALLITPTIFNGPQSMLQGRQVFQGLGQSNSLLKLNNDSLPRAHSSPAAGQIKLMDTNFKLKSSSYL